MCEPGFGLSPQCGEIVKLTDVKKIGCRQCQVGKTYSDTNKDYSSCKPCQICPDSHTVVRNCTLKANSECSRDCGKKFYFEETTGSCKQCSFCCHGKNEKKDDCKDMPFYEQCDAGPPYISTFCLGLKILWGVDTSAAKCMPRVWDEKESECLVPNRHCSSLHSSHSVEKCYFKGFNV